MPLCVSPPLLDDASVVRALEGATAHEAGVERRQRALLDARRPE